VNRRAFVKTCVGVAGAGALAASGLSMAAGLAIPRRAGGALIRYYGAHRVGGPAPRGVPLIPITVEDGKFVGKITVPTFDKDKGAATTDPNSVHHILDWYKYCGHAGAPGLKPDFTKDNTLTYFIADEKLKSITPWFKDLLGQPIKPKHFPADNFGASFIWRSKGQTGPNVLTGVIMKAEPEGKPLGPAYQTAPKAPGKALKSKDEYDFVRKNVHHEQFVALSTFCAHFCCIPGFKEAESLARPRDAWDNVFCTCHNSNYNFREPTAFTLSPETGAARPPASRYSPSTPAE